MKFYFVNKVNKINLDKVYVNVYYVRKILIEMDILVKIFWGKTVLIKTVMSS